MGARGAVLEETLQALNTTTEGMTEKSATVAAAMEAISTVSANRRLRGNRQFDDRGDVPFSGRHGGCGPLLGRDRTTSARADAAIQHVSRVLSARGRPH